MNAFRYASWNCAASPLNPPPSLSAPLATVYVCVAIINNQKWHKVCGISDAFAPCLVCLKVLVALLDCAAKGAEREGGIGCVRCLLWPHEYLCKTTARAPHCFGLFCFCFSCRFPVSYSFLFASFCCVCVCECVCVNGCLIACMCVCV